MKLQNIEKDTHDTVIKKSFDRCIRVTYLNIKAHNKKNNITITTNMLRILI